MKKIAALIFFAVAAAPAFAEESGIYAGITLGSASNKTVGANTLTTNSAGVYGGLLGYQFNKNLAVEGQFTGSSKFSTATWSGKADALSITAVGILPLNDSFSLYGKLGMARSSTKVSGTAAYTNGNRTAATYGAGVQYDINKQYGVRLGVDRYSQALNNAAGGSTNYNSTVWNAGAIYRF